MKFSHGYMRVLNVEKPVENVDKNLTMCVVWLKGTLY